MSWRGDFERVSDITFPSADLEWFWNFPVPEEQGKTSPPWSQCIEGRLGMEGFLHRKNFGRNAASCQIDTSRNRFIVCSRSSSLETKIYPISRIPILGITAICQDGFLCELTVEVSSQLLWLQGPPGRFFWWFPQSSFPASCRRYAWENSEKMNESYRWWISSWESRNSWRVLREATSEWLTWGKMHSTSECFAVPLTAKWRHQEDRKAGSRLSRHAHSRYISTERRYLPKLWNGRVLCKIQNRDSMVAWYQNFQTSSITVVLLYWLDFGPENPSGSIEI